MIAVSGVLSRPEVDMCTLSSNSDFSSSNQGEKEVRLTGPTFETGIKRKQEKHE